MKSISSFGKLFILTLFVGLFSLKSAGQNAYKPEHEGWLTSIDDAFAQSKKQNKPILANFTGSDWCGWCHRLSAAVFTQDEFKKWASKKVILLELDYPRRKEIPDNIRAQNAQLAQAFQITGYPTIWVFDLDKNSKTNQYEIKALGKTGYTPTASKFTSDIDQMIARRSKV